MNKLKIINLITLFAANNIHSSSQEGKIRKKRKEATVIKIEATTPKRTRSFRFKTIEQRQEELKRDKSLFAMHSVISGLFGLSSYIECRKNRIETKLAVDCLNVYKKFPSFLKKINPDIYNQIDNYKKINPEINNLKNRIIQHGKIMNLLHTSKHLMLCIFANTILYNFFAALKQKYN